MLHWTSMALKCVRQTEKMRNACFLVQLSHSQTSHFSHFHTSSAKPHTHTHRYWVISLAGTCDISIFLSFSQLLLSVPCCGRVGRVNGFLAVCSRRGLVVMSAMVRGALRVTERGNVWPCDGKLADVTRSDVTSQSDGPVCISQRVCALGMTSLFSIHTLKWILKWFYSRPTLS